MLVTCLGFIEPGKIAMLKSIATLVICTKSTNTEAKALRAYYSHSAYLANHGQLAYYGPMNANHGHPLALEIEENPPVRDVKIRRIAPWSWKDVMLLFMAMVITFLFGS